MAGLTRKLIKDAAKDAGVEIPNEMVDAIINAHVESRDAAVEAATKPLNEQLEAAKGQSATDEYKTKWEQEHEAFEKFKGEVENEKLTEKKRVALRALLTDAKIDEKHHDLVMKTFNSEMDKIELDNDGKIKGADAIKASVSTDWAVFVKEDIVRGAMTPTPPIGNVTPLGALQSQYDEAMRNGNTAAAVAAKNKIFELKKNGS